MTTATIEPGAFQYICDLVRSRSAIELDASKAYLVESRLAPVIRSHGFDSLATLVGALRTPGAQSLTREVIEAMTTHETSFFRDINPFEALRTTVLPEIIKRKDRERSLAIWSNACSSGQEIYSIAMLIREHFPELAGWKLKLVASDLSTQVLAKAQQGVFNQTEANRGLPMQMLVKYFQKAGLNWSLKEEVRKMVDFRIVNLIEPFPVLPQFDIVFLRNVLIYFAPETKTAILTRIHKVMSPGGYLFLGGAETTMNLHVPFQREGIGPCSVYRPA